MIQQGPIIEQVHGVGRRRFSISFSEDSSWISSEKKIMPAGTVGEANRKQLHDMLDAYLDKWMKETV